MVSLINSTVSGNVATSGQAGGGVVVAFGSATIRNSTITGNRGTTDGGVVVQGTVAVHNTIIAGNFRGTGSTASDISGGTVSPASSFNLVGDAGSAGGLAHSTNGNVVGNSGSGTITTSTIFNTTLANNGGPTQTHALVSGSPAIDAGSNAEAEDENGADLLTDQRASDGVFVRRFAGTTDIGAYEFQNVFTVGGLGDIVNPNDGAATLREAVAAANANPGKDTVNFAGAGTIELTQGELWFTESATLAGLGTSSSTITSPAGANQSRLLRFGDLSGVGEFEVNGLTLAGGNGIGSSIRFGGAIMVFDSFQGNDTLTIRDSVLDGNTAELGGAITATDATLNIIDSTISNNTATGTGDTRGGGGIAAQSATTTLTRVNVTNNSASKDGGGIYNFTFAGAPSQPDSVLNIIDSKIEGNIATNGRGGGIFNESQVSGKDAIVVLSGSSVSDNQANVGGGISSDVGINTVSNSLVAGNTTAAGGAGFFLVNSTTRIENSTVSGNNASGNGGGLENISTGPTAAVTLVNATFANNSAPQGEAINNFADSGGTAALTYANTIFADNTGAPLGNIVSFGPGTSSATSLGNNISDDATGNLTAAGDQPNTNPLLLALIDNGGSTRTHALGTSSPAIDAANNALAVDANGIALTTDQRGGSFDRILDGDIDGTATADIGAFEAPKVSQLIVAESDDETSVSESVGVDSFTVELNFQPATDVVVQLSGVDVTEFVLDQTAISFTPDNWNVPQTIQVMGIDDREQDGDIATLLTIAVDVENSDAEFSATSAHELTVTTTDNDATSTTGGGQGFDNHAPTQVVNYTIALIGLFPSRDGSLTDFEPFIGQIGIVGSGFAPGGSAFADGQILQISQHTALFSILGTTYGGDGITTFALPDLRGRVPIGADPDNGIPLGAEIGSTDVTLTEANLPSHTHTVSGSSVSLEQTGDGQSFDNQQPALALTPIVARQGIFDGLGEVVWFAGNFVPDRELPADGSLLPISSNTALFTMLGTTYGGDGETTFGLPDLRGRAAIGAGSGPGLTPRDQGDEIGEVGTMVTTANLPSHAHQLERGTVEATGSDTPLDNQHPATTLRYLVALSGIFPSRGGGRAPGRAIGGEPIVGQIALTSAVGQIPNGFALADGRLLDIASNQALFSLYGTTYGGDGRTAFGLPDLRGRLAAHDDSSHSLGTKHGAETVTLAEASMPPHSHVVTPPEEYVVTTAVDEIDFTNSDVSLREAVISANHHAGQQDITFAAALTGSTIMLSAGQLELVDDVTITGPGMAADLIIDAQQNSRVFRIDTGVTATLTRLTATNGDADNNVERAFSGSIGGGILNAAGTLTLNDVQITNSKATWGGGINNYGPEGTATINVLNSTVAQNEANSNAGGLYNWGHQGNAVANIVGSTFTENTAGRSGGAVYNWQATAQFNASNSSFVSNSANVSGGAVTNDAAMANLVNSTISGNSASSTAGGIRTLSGIVKLENSIVAGNTLTGGDGSEFAGAVDSTSANNLIGDAATAGGLTNGTNNNIVGVDWKTVLKNDGTNPTLADNGGKTQTVALRHGSSAIDAGSTSSIDADQRGIGFDRILDGNADGSSVVDIGAFEFTAPVLTVSIAADSVIENGSTTATVSRSGDTSVALTVSLSSSDTTEATVPTTVTIAAGQTTSPAFIISVADDTDLDGTQTVTVTASATGTFSGNDTVNVTDNETAALTVTIVAASVAEGGITTVTVSRNGDTSAALVVTLASDDTTEATVPATVTIEAGQITSPSGTILAVDDTDVDGTQIATITASATGLTSGSDSVEITDNDVAPENLQHISSDSATKSAAPGGTLSVPVVYRTQDANGDPVALQSNLISFNIHYDSTALTFLETTGIFSEGIQVVPNVGRPESDEAVVGDDNDAATDMVLVASYTDTDANTDLGWPNLPVVDGQVLYVAHFEVASDFTGSTVNFSANAVGSVTGQSAEFGFSSESVVVGVTDNLGNVDGDDDFDASDAFLIQLVKLAGSDTQIDQSKGASSLTAAEIRANIEAIGSGGDVDGDGDFDASDSFLIQLTKLAGSNSQIDQSKGASPLSAVEIRARIDDLGSGNTGQRFFASAAPRLAAVSAEPESSAVRLFEVMPAATNVEDAAISNDIDDSAVVWEDFRTWIDAL